MQVELKTAFAMIKGKKGQSFIIGLILVFTSLLLFTGISLMNNSEAFEDMYERGKGSHTLLIISENLHDYDKIINWWRNQDEVENVNLINVIDVKIEILKGNQNQGVEVKLAEYDPSKKYDLLVNMDMEKPMALTKDKVYVNSAFARRHGVNKEDTLKVLLNEEEVYLTVADIVVDPQYSSLLNHSRLWVSENFHRDYNIEKKATVGIRYFNYDKTKESSLIKSFDEFTKNDFAAHILSFETIQISYSMIFTIISGILLLVTLIMMIIIIFIVRNTISNNIMDNYKSIGIMKATGYSSKSIILIYGMTFTFITLVASLAGIAIGYKIQELILTTLKGALSVPVSGEILVPGILTLGLIMILVSFFSIITARRAGKIKPLQAIKYGRAEEGSGNIKITLKQIGNMPISLLLAIKQIFAKLKQSVVIVLSLSFIIFLSITMASILDTFRGDRIIEDFTSIPIGDMTIGYNGEASSEEILSELKDLEEIDNAIGLVHDINSSVYSNKHDKQLMIARTLVYGNTDSFGISLLKGISPRGGNEILFTTKLSEETGKDIGDYVNIKTPWGEKKYLITGLYQSIVNLGLAYAVPYTDDNKDEGPGPQVYYTVKFSDRRADFDGVKATLYSKFDGKVEVMRLDDIAETVKGLTDQLPLIFISLLGIFYIVCGAAVVNWTIMDIKRSSKTYGILKVSGLSHNQIIQMIVFKGMLLTLAASFVAAVVGSFAAPYLLKGIMYFTPYQIINIQFHISIITIFLTVGFYLIITLIATLLPAGRIKKITPRILIVD